MDNLSVHKVAGVRGRIEATGAGLLYLPPYSPHNRIEQAWSKVKQILRSLKARTTDALEAAVAESLAAITPENAIWGETNAKLPPAAHLFRFDCSNLRK
jgi:transposase